MPATQPHAITNPLFSEMPEDLFTGISEMHRELGIISNFDLALRTWYLDPSPETVAASLQASTNLILLRLLESLTQPIVNTTSSTPSTTPPSPIIQLPNRKANG